MKPETKTTLNNVGLTRKNAHTHLNAAGSPDGLVVLTMRVGEQHYALPVSDIVEVAAMVEVVRVAGQPPEVLGMVNRRGTPLILLDLKAVFNVRNGKKSQETAFSDAENVTADIDTILNDSLDVNTLFVVACPDFATHGYLEDESAQGKPSVRMHFIGLIADEIQQVEYTATGMSEVSLLTPNTPRYVRGIINHKSRLIQVIEVSALMRAYVPAFNSVED